MQPENFVDFKQLAMKYGPVVNLRLHGSWRGQISFGHPLTGHRVSWVETDEETLMARGHGGVIMAARNPKQMLLVSLPIWQEVGRARLEAGLQKGHLASNATWLIERSGKGPASEMKVQILPERFSIADVRESFDAIKKTPSFYLHYRVVKNKNPCGEVSIGSPETCRLPTPLPGYEKYLRSFQAALHQHLVDGKRPEDFFWSFEEKEAGLVGVATHPRLKAKDVDHSDHGPCSITPSPAAPAPQGICQCTMADLMSTGHAPSCPEKKR